MIYFKIRNCDDNEVEYKFNNVEEMLENWNDEENGTTLPMPEDELLEFDFDMDDSPFKQRFVNTLTSFVSRGGLTFEDVLTALEIAFNVEF